MQYDHILIRYGELALKGKTVKSLWKNFNKIYDIN